MAISFLVQNTAADITLFLETTGSAPATGLGLSDVTVDLKKTGDTSFSNKILAAAVSATSSIGSGANGTVNVTVDAAGSAGNAFTIEVLVPAGTSSLSAALVGSNIEVSLDVTAGVPNAAANTATLVAAAVDGLAAFSATASGTGADSLSSAEGPNAFTGGSDATFEELSDGFYTLDLSATDTDTLGNLDVRVTGPTIKTALVKAFVAASVPTSPTGATAPQTTALFGTVFNGDGSPAQDATVSARILSQPTILHPAEDGLAVAADLVSASTDSNGFFSISLISGTQVDIFIPVAGYRRTLTVPSTSQNLFDLP